MAILTVPGKSSRRRKTLQEQLEAKADECLLLACFEAVTTWICRLKNVSVVVPISQENKNYFTVSKYTHLPGNGHAPSSNSCFLTAVTPLHSELSL